MKKVPLSIIQAAQVGDTEALSYVFNHFKGYIASHSLVPYEDPDGEKRSYVSDDLRYLANVALSNAIFKFWLREPRRAFPLDVIPPKECTGHGTPLWGDNTFYK